MAETIVVDANGRVYLPKLIRRLLGLHPNSLMEIDVLDDQVVLKRVDSVADKGRGMFRNRGKSKGIDVDGALGAARTGYGVDA